MNAVDYYQYLLLEFSKCSPVIIFTADVSFTVREFFYSFVQFLSNSFPKKTLCRQPLTVTELKFIVRAA